MDLEVLSILILLAASAGALLTLLALGYFRRKEAVHEALGEGAPDGPPQARGRPGAGPAHGWFVKAGGRLAEIRYQRVEEVVQALARDLAECRDMHFQVGMKRKQLEQLRRLAWPRNEAVFLARPLDPFLLVVDRPLEVFDPRYDRYMIVPMGFMEAAGGVEAFMGAFAFDVLANQRPPLDAGEALLRDAAEAALAAGFAPPDIFKTMVQMLRQQVFAGRYRPFLAAPRVVPGKAEGRPPVPAEPPPLSQPVTPQAPPTGKKPGKPKD